MPHPENRLPFQIGDDLAQARIWELIDEKITLAIACDACHHKARWTPEMLEKKLGRKKVSRLVVIAHRIRCGRCRSFYIKIWRERG